MIFTESTYSLADVERSQAKAKRGKIFVRLKVFFTIESIEKILIILAKANNIPKSTLIVGPNDRYHSKYY